VLVSQKLAQSFVSSDESAKLLVHSLQLQHGPQVHKVDQELVLVEHQAWQFGLVAIEGDKVGDWVGLKLGCKEGIDVGIVEGCDVGINEGCDDGINDGCDVGIIEGCVVGSSEGSDDGIKEGFDVGINEGCDVGVNEGVDVGSSPQYEHCLQSFQVHLISHER